MDTAIPRVVIAGDRSSAGKTTICMGLLSVLRAQGLVVQSYKVGLDYIDPGFHTLVSGRNSRNLDGFLMSQDVVKELFIRGSAGADIAVIEGVRGLYEGLNYFDDVGSTAEIAKILRCPVILVIDAGSITRSVAAIVNGYKSLDPELRIAGVILNNIGSVRHGDKAEKAVEKYSGVEVIGKIPRQRDLGISMRHLGLITATECEYRVATFDSVLKKIKASVETNVDLNRLLDVAKSAPALNLPVAKLFRPLKRECGYVKIAVAFDEAFNFYYQDTLDLLVQEGAELVFFSPIRDKKLPDGVDAVYIGGGFPEIYGAELSANTQMRRGIKGFYDRYGVIYAECGGLMYLMDELEYAPVQGLRGRDAEHQESNSYEMCGVLRGRVKFGEKRVVNYVIGEFKNDCIIGRSGDRFKGHEFHHSEITLEDDVEFAYTMLRGEGIKGGMDGIITKNCLAAYAHLHAASYTEFATMFVESARKRKNGVGAI